MGTRRRPTAFNFSCLWRWPRSFHFLSRTEAILERASGMESPPDQLPEPFPIPAPSPSLEIVLLDGRQPGTRRPLHLPLTLIGRADHCDIRLNADGVEPVHCALVMTPTGPLLRALQRVGVSYVNDEPAATCHLRPDDIVR